ncbi:MAG: ZIP family metal transporter [Saprospiraceae bacterium]
MGILEYLLLFSSVLIGGGLAFYLRRNDRNLVQLLLSFSGAYILGITFLHLVPETYHGNSQIGFFVLVGFFIQLLLEQLSRGVEHGHIHAFSNTNTSAAFAIMVGLCLHAFIEGLPLDFHNHDHSIAIEVVDDNHHNHAHEHDEHNHSEDNHEGHDHAEHNHSEDKNQKKKGGINHLLFAIVLHKIPAAFALGILLLLSKFKERTVIIYLAIFGAMSPLAAAIGSYLNSQGMLSAYAISAIMAIVIGSFLHIATTILFETDTNHKIPVNKLIAILIGLGIAILTVQVGH